MTTLWSCSRLRLMVTHCRVGADHVGEIGMREGGSDQDAVRILDAVSLDEMEQQVRKALRDRAGTEHLREPGVAFALEGQALDQADGKAGYLA